jgi:hypothetical protein
MSKHQKKQRKEDQTQPQQQKENWSPTDFEKVGPRSIEGVEASDLPDKGRGDLSTNPSKEAGRKLPQQTGQWDEGDTGLRADPEVADAGEHGHRKHN